ncbi:caspase family protein [Gloeobacter violaceus]|uniref:WD-40 repeat protein n=1 Tax=Gloeobacter violaceus (strain ATCC 29082 / PCC 7421) TaxID=251221 RepID=Q7NK50_GLOVI|nr:caspase family protein [Gloeobacter violaceus]BAC89571.1 WD-40 repeat protein [Gloeobacter violaceus PCC 7421]
MSPVGIRSPQTGRRSLAKQGKLWMLLVGINDYQDPTFAGLRYCVADCQGIHAALLDATPNFSGRECFVFQDRGVSAPPAAGVLAALEQIAERAQPEDTLLFYFCGHGVIDPATRQAVLCLADTRAEEPAETGLELQRLLARLGRCSAQQQLVWIDACHSGGMSIGDLAAGGDPGGPMVAVLRERAARSQGFYAILSCDRFQRSWEFSELGHGLFTYFLMRGLRGEAANYKGEIEVDHLYRYVCQQARLYIDNRNRQLRLLNRQKQRDGETDFFPEYPPQTPKRIVEGVGTQVIGLKVPQEEARPLRRALVVDGFAGERAAFALGPLLQGSGGFEVAYWPQPGRPWSEVREAIKTCLTPQGSAQEHETVLIYLRAPIERTAEGETLCLGGTVRLSPFWLRRELQYSGAAQQIVVLDCPGGGPSLADWTDCLLVGSERSQCLVAAASPQSDPERFLRVLLATIETADSQTGLSAASWIDRLQNGLTQARVGVHVGLTGETGIIEILPAARQNFASLAAADLKLCPYMGLRAFAEEDAPYYFGRAVLARDLLSRLERQVFVAVVGASGSGKSSLVQAGLLAQLRTGRHIPGSQHWWSGSFRPGAQPIAALSRRLAEGHGSGERLDAGQQIEGLLHLGAQGLLQWLAARQEPVVLLVIDQFEELFTLASPQERRDFLAVLLGALAGAAGRLKLVVTLRADFIGPCLEESELAPLLQQGSFLVPPVLVSADYRQIICKPAQQVNLQVEPELVEALLEELSGSAGGLPLLEFALEQLWQVRSEGRLTLQAYRQEVGGLQGALEARAERVYADLTTEERECAQWIFLSLTQLGEGTEDTRRRVHKSELVVERYSQDLVERTLQALTAAKLVVVDLEEGQPAGTRSTFGTDIATAAAQLRREVTVEVAHEVLIRHWSTLRWWLEENRARLRVLRQIEQAAFLWNQKQRQKDFLLQGVRLSEAEELIGKFADQLTATAQQFVVACLAERGAQRAQERRRLRVAQIAAVAMAILAAFAAVAGLFAYKQVEEVQHSRIDTLISESKLLFADHRQLDALISSVRAAQLARQFFSGDKQLNEQTDRTLQKVIFNIEEANRLEGYIGTPLSCDFSPDGKFILCGDSQGNIYLQNRSGQTIKSWKGHESVIYKVDFSPDSLQFATAGEDKIIRLWSVNGELLKTLRGHTERVHSIRYSSSGRLLASMSSNSIKLWDKTGKFIRSINRNIGEAIAFGWSPDEELLAIPIIAGNSVEITSLSGQLLRVLKGHTQPVNGANFSPDGNQIASFSSDKTVRLWNAKSGKFQHAYSGHTDAIWQVEFSPDSSIFASAGEDRTVRLWSKDGHSLKILSGHTDRVMDVRFSPEGTHLLSASFDKSIRLWQVNNLYRLSFKGNGSEVLSMRFSPVNNRVLAAAANKDIYLWSHDGKLIAKLIGHEDLVQNFDIRPDGKQIVSVSSDRTIRLWSSQGKLLKIFPRQTNWPFFIRYISSDIIASAGHDNQVHLWSLDGSLLQTFKGHTDSTTGALLLQDKMASFSWDGTIRLWQLNGKLIKVLTGHKGQIYSFDFQPADNILASADSEGEIRLWRGDGSLLAVLSGHRGSIYNLKFSPDGRILASGSMDGTVRLWTARGKLLAVLAHHSDSIRDVRFSPNGKYLATASEDGTVRIWNLKGDLLSTLDVGNSVTALAFSPDGHTLASGSADGTLELWKQWRYRPHDVLESGCQWLQNYTSLATDEKAGEVARACRKR